MVKRSRHFGYGAFLVIALLLTLIALFTPGWRSYKGHGAPHFGLVSRYCGNGNRQINEYDCKAWGRWFLPFEKTTLAFMIISLLLQIVSVGLFFGLFSPRARLGMPTFLITTLAFFTILIAVIIYGVRMQYKTAYLQSTTYELLANVYLGFSYWIALVATLFLSIAAALSGGLIPSAEEVEHLH